MEVESVTTSVRLAISVVGVVVTFFFVSTIGRILALTLHFPFLISFVGAVAAAVFVARSLSTRPDSRQPGLVRCVMVGALTTGGLCFAVGFFGPMLWAPDSNLGPLLGVVTGPIGSVLGAGGGGVYWWALARQPRTTRP